MQLIFGVLRSDCGKGVILIHLGLFFKSSKLIE